MFRDLVFSCGDALWHQRVPLVASRDAVLPNAFYCPRWSPRDAPGLATHSDNVWLEGPPPTPVHSPPARLGCSLATLSATLQCTALTLPPPCTAQLPPSPFSCTATAAGSVLQPPAVAPPPCTVFVSSPPLSFTATASGGVLRPPAVAPSSCTVLVSSPPLLPLPQPPEVYFGHPQYAAVGNLFWPSAWQGQVKDSAYEMHGLKPGATKVWECVWGGGTYFSSQVHGRARSRTQPTRCMG